MLLPLVGDGKAVYLLLDAIYKSIYIALARDTDLSVHAHERTRFVVIVLYHTGSGNINSRLAHNIERYMQMLFAAVKEYKIGRCPKCAGIVRKMRKAPFKRFTHCAVVICSVSGSYGKATVIPLKKAPALNNDHTRRHMLIAEIGNIVCFNVFRWLWKSEKF